MKDTLKIRFWWFLPILAAVVVYYPGLNNYFTSDDFMWLERGLNFKRDWLQMFRPEGAYFDPVVHLLFSADYAIAGLDYRWYHLVDLAIHAINALLVYRLARLLSDDERAPLYGGILFAGSFAIADAVLWSASRVDLLSTLFSLGSLIQFLHYLRCGQNRRLGYSFLLFALALCSKSTPLILPGILFLFIPLERKPLRLALRLIPFAALAVAYAALLKLTAHLAALPVDRLHFNLHNVAVAICALFIPEEALAHLNPVVCAIALFVIISWTGLASLRSEATVALRRTGYALLISAILPVIVLGDFTLATGKSQFIDLMGSPSHRIYLASVGAALLGGCLLSLLERGLRHRFPRCAFPAIMVLVSGIVAVDCLVVKERDHLWEAEGNRARVAVDFIRSYRVQAEEGSQIGLIAFPVSRIYMEPMIRRQLRVNDATFNHYVDIGIQVDPKILQKAEKSFLFVFGRDGHVYDESASYRRQLLLSRRALETIDNPAALMEAQTATMGLIGEINAILGL